MTVKPSQIDALSTLLQQAEQLHRVVSQNVANVNTPGYKSQEVHFEDAFRQSLESLQQPVEGVIQETAGLAARADGNNVDLDRELGALTKNSLKFETFSNLLVARLSMLRSAITGN